ncbi:MAG: chromate resistance protein ChrB domain-containing protein [Betaproteobacteria bacterium]
MDTSTRAQLPSSFPPASPGSSSLSPQDFSHYVGMPDAPVILDVRRAAKFVESPSILAAAQRCLPEDVAAFADSRAPGRAIVYCVYGHNVSEDAVRILRDAGWNATAVAGGIEGGQEGTDTPQDITAWRANRPLIIPKRPDLGVTGESPSRWITRERPKIDRVACPWLIRRFIDPRAEFIYVKSAMVLAEAQRLNAVAYDIPGAPITHEGELCSFDMLLRAFGLERLPSLEILARIVRGADTDRLELAPQSAGLLALSLGLSALHATDDAAMLEAAMPMYDALHAWCRSRVGGGDETHSWNPQSMKGAAA